MTSTTRPRHPFKYTPDPAIDGTDDTPALDAQEQDELITHLSTSDRATNQIYVKIFTALPLIGVLVYLYGLRLRSHRGRGRAIGVLGLLGVTSLVASAMEMWFVRLSWSNSSEDGRMGDDDGGVARHLSRSRVRRVPFTDVEIDDDGPIGRVLPHLNVGICALLGALGVVEAMAPAGEKSGNGDGLWVVLLLPGLILGVVTVVQRSVREVEEGIEELGRLKYGYTGA